MNDDFAVSRKQLHRMKRIVALLKQEKNVTRKRMLEVLAESEYESNCPILTCSVKTLQRDLNILKEEFDCPIEYDHSERVYVFTGRYWSLPVPAVLNEEELFAIILGGKMAKDMLPPLVARRITEAVNQVVACNSTPEITSELVDSLKILATSSTDISSKTFLLVFDAWRTRRRIAITYADWQGNVTEREVDPQVLIFHEMEWSIKGFCHLRNRNQSFYLKRMRSVRITDEYFRRDRALIDSINVDTVFFKERVQNIAIRLTAAGRQFAETHILHSKQTFAEQEDGSWLMLVPDGAVKLVVPWVMRQAGEASVVSPPELVEEVRGSVRKLMESCGMA